MNTRREFLRNAILLSGAAGLSGKLQASITKAVAIDPQPGSSFLDAEHVVILMQENRSFDHCFGALRGVRGFNDPRAVTLPDKNLVWLQTNKAGETYLPFRFDIRDTKITWMGSVPHSRSSQVDADNRGRYDQWLDAKRSGNQKYADMPLTLGHYTREDLPFNYAMADAFTVCDQNFSSAMTSTWPNRLFLWGGTIREEKNDSSKAYIRNDIPYGEARWKTFPERLEENGIAWKVYQNDISAGGGFEGDERAWLSNFGCNPLEFLSQYNVRFYSRYVQSLQKQTETLPNEITELEGRLAATPATDKSYDKLQKDIAKKKEVLNDAKGQLQQWSAENFENLSSFQKNIYQKAFTINDADPEYRTLTALKYDDNGVERALSVPKSDVLYQFRQDVDSGKLPTVSWLVPSQNISDHPSAPWYGAWLVSEILDILTNNPDVWKKTIFILTYDENDGYFDHIPPFVAPDHKETLTGKCSPGIPINGEEYVRLENELRDGIAKKEARGGPVGLGFRVPMIVASPWSRGGKVCSQVFDHTSSLQFLEEFLNKKFKKNIRETNISEWRRAVCGNLTSAFTVFDEKEQERLPFLKRDLFVETIYNAKFKEEPSNFKKVSPEEIQQINRDPAASSLMPQQEPGTKPANPLPYELYAGGILSRDKKSFEIKMEARKNVFGEKAAGSPFSVYAPGEYVSLEAEKASQKTFEPLRPWHFAVKAGEAVIEKWPLGNFKDDQYHLRLYGPNGFFREFAGNAQDPDIHVDCAYQTDVANKNQLTGNLIVSIVNLSKISAYDIEIEDNAYKAPPVSKKIGPSKTEVIALNLSKSFGWYDFSVGLPNKPGFIKRFAGRVETGKETYTDPFMGRG
ncbi:phosphocholine-specific phospholipase C [Parafilimonas sp.]|uniref:phosphocholine-specific phospholipase C n=1 Tax=Parafilimonas sp. TaxID=1969739 RepID=UPI0039E4436E